MTLTSHAGVMNVPDSFFGLSTEYWALPLYGRHISLFERVLSLLHAGSHQPLVLRIGGDSADRSFWDAKLRNVPPWVFTLTPAWLSQASRIVRHVGARLILDLNLVTGSPAIAAQWARTAEKHLPRQSIVAFEVGNEPDIYRRRYWLAITSQELPHDTILPSGLSASSYIQSFQSYARVLAHVAPGVPLAGPAVANPVHNLSWVSGLLASDPAGLGL